MCFPFATYYIEYRYPPPSSIWHILFLFFLLKVATQIIEALDGEFINGRKVRLNFALEKYPSTYNDMKTPVDDNEDDNADNGQDNYNSDNLPVNFNGVEEVYEEVYMSESEPCVLTNHLFDEQYYYASTHKLEDGSDYFYFGGGQDCILESAIGESFVYPPTSDHVFSNYYTYWLYIHHTRLHFIKKKSWYSCSPFRPLLLKFHCFVFVLFILLLLFFVYLIL